jgi:hypothetical protein
MRWSLGVESTSDCCTQNMNKEERMNKWWLSKGALTLLNTVLDEILQFALFAHQAVPWLLSGPPGRTLG